MTPGIQHISGQPAQPFPLGTMPWLIWPFASAAMRWGRVACTLLWPLRWWWCQWRPMGVNMSRCFLSEHVSRKAPLLLVSQVTVGPTWFFTSEYRVSSHSGLYCWERLMHNGNQSFCAFSLSWWLTSWHWVGHTAFLEAFLCLSMKTRATDSSCIMMVFAGPTSPLSCHLVGTQRIHLASFAEAGESPCLSPAGDFYSEVTWWGHAYLMGTRLWCCSAVLPPFCMMEGDFPAAWSPESAGSRGSGDIRCTWVSVSNTLPIFKATYKAGLFVAIDPPT